MAFDPFVDKFSVGDQVVVQYGSDEPRTGVVTRAQYDDVWVKGKGMKFDGTKHMGVYHATNVRWMLLKGFIRMVEVEGPGPAGNQL